MKTEPEEVSERFDEEESSGGGIDGGFGGGVVEGSANYSGDADESLMMDLM